MKRDTIMYAAPVLAAVVLFAGWHPGSAQARTQERETGQKGMERESQHQRSQSRAERERSRRPIYQATGEIERVKKVKVKDGTGDHLIVQMLTDRGRRIFVDLGPAKNLKDIQVISGDEIAVRGPFVRISDRPVLLAQKIHADGQTIRVKRQGPAAASRGKGQQRETASVSGEVKAVSELKVHGSDKKHLVARLHTQDDRKIIADLGAVKDLRDLQIKSGQQLTVQGKKSRVNGLPFIIADQISTDGRTVQIDRELMSAMPVGGPSGMRSQSSGASDTERVTGEVVVKGEVYEIDRDGFYIVRDQQGREVHMIVAEEMNRGIQVGDQIEAQVKPDGSVVAIQKAGGQS